MAKKLIVNEDKITAVADAIRTKTNTKDKMTLDDMPTKISSISSGGGNLVTNPLPKPLSYIDYNTNTLYIWPHPLCGLFGADEWVELTVNGTKIPWTEFDKFRPVNNMDSDSSHATSIAGDTINFGAAGYDSIYPNDCHMGLTLGADEENWIYNKGQGTTETNRQLLAQSEYVIPKVKGSTSIKIKYKTRNITEDNPKKITANIHLNALSEANTIGNGLPENANYNGTGFDSKISANLFTDSPEISYDYTMNEYNINITDEVLNQYSELPALNDILYTANSLSGTLKATFDYNGYSYQLTTVSDTSKKKYPFTNENEVLTSTNNKVDNSYSYAKITFALAKAKTVTLSCKSYGEKNYDYGIISNIDKELSDSARDDGATGSTTVLHNFKGEASATFKDVSFGEVSAGEHFFTIKYRKDSSSYINDDNFVVKLPSDIFYLGGIDTGKYLPANITVTDADTNEVIPDTEYEYSPYTGKFNIPMTHNWNMTAVASTIQLSPEVPMFFRYFGNTIKYEIYDKTLVYVPIEIEMNGISQGSITTSSDGYASKNLVPNINGENIIRVRSNVSGKLTGRWNSKKFWFNATDKPLYSTAIEKFYNYNSGRGWDKVYCGYWNSEGMYIYCGTIKIVKGNTTTETINAIAEINPESNEKILWGNYDSNIIGMAKYMNDKYIFGTKGYAVYDHKNRKIVSSKSYDSSIISKISLYNNDYNYLYITNSKSYGDTIYLIISYRNESNKTACSILWIKTTDNTIGTIYDNSYFPEEMEVEGKPENVRGIFDWFKVGDNFYDLLYIVSIRDSSERYLMVRGKTVNFTDTGMTVTNSIGTIQTELDDSNGTYWVSNNITGEGTFTIFRNYDQKLYTYRCKITTTNTSFRYKLSLQIGDGNNEKEAYTSNYFNQSGCDYNMTLDTLGNRYLVGCEEQLQVYIK